jgi:hypothetical protein
VGALLNEDTELGAIQHAYNLLIDDGEDVFASECQNEPFKAKEDLNSDAPTADEITAKTNGVARGVVPIEGSRVVAFVDVQKEYLAWMVCGFGDGFTGAVVDYGTYPDQKRATFHRRDVRETLAKATKATTFEAQIYAGLDACVNGLMGREWKREDGTLLKPEKILVDASYGDSTETVKLFCRRSPHAAVLMPSHGRYCGAKSRPLNDGKAKLGERRGWGWKIPAGATRTNVRHVLFDTNAWKTRMAGLIRVPMGGRGCLTLFGKLAEAHKLLAEHLTAEVPTRVTANGRTVTEWTIRVHRPDNEWLDGLVGCGVAASILGVTINDDAPTGPAKKRIKLSELQKQKAKR